MRSQRTSARQHEQIMASNCDVCFLPFGRAVPKQLSQGLQVLLCSKCSCRVHRSCYDLHASGTILTAHLTQFLCDACRGERTPCLICLGTEGALKAIKPTGFVHVFCGLIHKGIDVRSYYPSIEFEVGDLTQCENKCEICGRSNAEDKCAQETCKRTVHALCAMRQHTNMEKEDEEPKCWKYLVSTGNNGKFNLTDQPISEGMLREEVITIIEDINEKGLEIIPVDGVLREKHREYMEEKGKKREDKLKRGGFSYVMCEVHSFTMYCFCANKEGGGEMVLCECCLEWYHQKCVKYETVVETYICPLCDRYYEQKRRMVEEVKAGKGEGGELRAKMPAKMSIHELVWVMRVLDGRAETENAAKLIKELSKYPLKSSRIPHLVKALSKTKLIALAEDVVTEYLRSPALSHKLRPSSVLTLSPNKLVVPNEEAIRYCERVRTFILHAEQFLLRRRVSSPFTPLKARLDFKADALSDSYERIIELSKVDEDYQELPLLKLKSTNYGYLDTLRQLQSHQLISYEALVQAAAQARETPLPTHSQPLLQKADLLAGPANQLHELFVNSPASIAEIATLLQPFTAERVKPPQEYTCYRRQKAFVSQLFLYHAKSSKSQTSFDADFNSQINSLLTTPLKASPQLLEIVNNSTPPPPHFPWPHFPQLYTSALTIATLFQIQSTLQRKPIKQDKLISLMAKAKELNLHIQHQEVHTLLQKWQSLQAALSLFAKQSITECDSIQLITQYLQTTQSLSHCLSSLGLAIEEETWGTMVRVRKEELQQLMVLYTEAQLHKNPLTIPKLLHSISRNNSLVKNYYHLKKEQGHLVLKYNTLLLKVTDKLDVFKNDPKMQRKEQIRHNSDKPSLIEAQELLQTIKNTKVQLNKEIKELTRMLNNSLEIANKVKTFLQRVNDAEYISMDLGADRKEIDQLRKRVLNTSQFSLKSEMIGLYHAEILNRMRSSLQTPTIDLQKASVMLKYAQEERLTHNQAYLLLKEKYDARNQRTKEQSLFKQHQLLLQNEAAKDTSPTYSGLYIVRKGLPLAEAHGSKNAYIAELQEKHKQIAIRVSDILKQTKGKTEYTTARKVYLDALKSPFQLPEIAALSLEIAKGNELLKRWKELQKNYTPYDPIFLDFDRSILKFEEVEQVRSQLKHNQERLDSLQYYIDVFDPIHREPVQDAVHQIESSAILKETEICFKAQIRYLQYWCKLLKVYVQSRQQTIPYDKLRKLAVDAYSLLQRALKRNEDHSALKDIISLLEEYLSHVKSEVKNAMEVASQGYLVDSFIDVEDLVYEMQNGLDIEEEIPIYRPYIDLTRFKYKTLYSVEPKLKEAESGKRIRSESKIEEEREEETKGVSANQRKKITEIFLKNVQKNHQLKKVGSFEEEIKEIQKQIYAQSNGDVVKYLQTSELFQKVFIKLIKCPHFSNRLVKKKFEFSFLQLMTNNYATIQKLQSTLEKKAKEQEREMVPPQALPLPLAAPDPLPTIDKELHLIAKDKKKRRRRSPSREEEAQFSPQEEHGLPSYIENEYNNQEKSHKEEKTVFPMLYDPQEQMQQEGFQSGAVLRLKECELEMSLKKRGRVEIKALMYTEEDWRRVEGETMDPGFDKLTLRRDKTDSQILSYINKSKKKYRYLIGWFEAVNPTENESLRELAVEASDKHKVYGWQNEHIKLHVMSIKQFVMLPKLPPPGKVSCAAAAQIFNEDRLVFIIQYPERTYEIRGLYQTFTNIVAAPHPCTVNIPPPPIQQPIIIPPPLLPIKPIFEPIKRDDYETWGSESLPYNPQPSNPYEAVRVNLGFTHFSPIMTDEEDNPTDKVDLASNLLNKISALGKMPPPPPRQAPYPMYGAYPPYQGRGYPQQMYPQQPIYNPLANKFPMAPMPRNPMNYGPPRPNYYDGRYHNYPQ